MNEIKNSAVQTSEKSSPAATLPLEVLPPGVLIENGELYYCTKGRKFVLRLKYDEHGAHPVWAYDGWIPSLEPPASCEAVSASRMNLN